MEVTRQSQLARFCATSKRVKWIGAYVLVLIALVSWSCGQRPTGRYDDQLSIEAANTSTQFSMTILPNKLGKLALKDKFVGIVPRRLAEGSQEQEIDFYVIDAPNFKFEDFTLDKIAQQRLTPKKVTSLEQLTADLNSLGLGFGNLTVARKVETSVTGGKLKVKDLDNNTSVECTCPCTVQFGDDKVKYSCD